MRSFLRRVPRFIPFARPALGVAALLSAVLPAAAGSLRLKDGTVLQGEEVSRNDSVVVFRSASLGELRIPLSALPGVTFGPSDRSALLADRLPAYGDSVRPDAAPADGPSQARHAQDPSDHALFFMPTAFTPPKASFLFRDFELLFLTFGFAPTASTTMTAGLLFPISSDFQFLTAGIKQQLWMSDDKRTALALTGNISNPVGDFLDDVGFLVNSNAVLGFRAPNEALGVSDGFGAHIALGYLGSERTDEDYNPSTGNYEKSSAWDGQYTLGLGAEMRLTRNAKFIGEYLSTAPFGDVDSDLDAGILTFGFRLHGNRLSADIAGLRPLTDDDLDSFIFWPLLVVSYRI